MATSVDQWLEDLDLGKYLDLFSENDIDLAALPHITEDDLKELGVTLGARRRILAAIQTLAVDTAPAAEQPVNVNAPTATRSATAERRQLTVLFCDMVGSTELSGRLDPEDLRDVMRRYQDAVAGAVTRYGGHIAKYLGDGVLAYFGWPQAYEDQADRAVRAGLDAVRAVGKLYAAESEPLQARVGIETGQVVVGDLIGESARDAEAVSGETPNLAARLQQAAKPEQVIIGPVTRRLVRQAFVLDDMGAQPLKGFAEPVHAWAVVGEAGSESRFESYQGASITNLFGRQHELGLLEDRWQQSKADGGQVVVLSGEAGIGKSRLVQALRDHVSGELCFRLRYQCSPHHLNNAFYPVIQRLERSARFSEADSDVEKLDKLEALLRLSKTDIDAVAPFFAILLSLPGADRYGTHDLAPRQVRERIFEALIGQVLDLARQRPVFFILEDAHWIDPTTEALVGQLMDSIADVPVFVLVTHRPDHVPPWARHSYLTSVALNRLGRDQAAKIVHSTAGDELPAEVADRIVARADGIPLYLEELTKSILEAGEATGSIDASGTIPETLQALLAARLDRLAEAKEIAQIGAVIGREFPYRLIAALAKMPTSEVDTELERLVQSGLAYRRGTPPDATYIFKHALIQDAAYDGLLLSRRRDLHAKVVTTVEQLYSASLDENVELLAYHAQRGEQWEKSLGYCRLAGRKANERSAYSEALNFLEAGLHAAKKAPENENNLRAAIDIRLSMRPSLGAFGQYRRFLEVLSEAEVAAQSLGDDYTTAHVSIEKTHVLYQTGHAAEGVETGHKAVAMARAVDHQRLIVGAEANLAMALFFSGELREALAVASEHAEALTTTFRHDQLGTTSTSSVNWLGNLAGMQAMLGELEAARNYVDEAVTIATETNKPFDLAMAGQWQGFVQLCADKVPAALQTLERTFLIVEEHGFDFLYPWAGIHLGMARSLRPTRQSRRVADEWLTRATAKAEQLDLVLAQIWAVASSVKAKIRADLPEAAVTHASNALARAREHGFQWLEVLALHQLGHGTLLSATTRFEDAEDFYLQAIGLADRLEARLLLADAERGLGEAYATVGRPVEASERLRRASELYQSMGLSPHRREADTLLDELS